MNLYRQVLCAMVLGLVCAVFSSCAFLKPRPTKATPPGPTLIGGITLVNEASGFVLIESAVSVAPDSVLKSLSLEGVETSTLKASKEQRPPFVTADIVTGKPQRGDQVFQ